MLSASLSHKSNFYSFRCVYLGLAAARPVWALSSHSMARPSLTISAALFSFTGQMTMRYGRTVLVTRMASHWERRSYTSSWVLCSGSEGEEEKILRLIPVNWSR